MLIVFTRVKNIFIVCGRTDMLKGMDGLASIIQYEYNMDLYDDAIFLFCGGKSDRFKVLYWDGDLYKRVNDGKLKWPRTKCHGKKELVIIQERKRGKGECNLPITNHDRRSE